MSRSRRLWLPVVGLAASFHAASAYAEIVLGHTRAVYHTENRDITLALSNTARGPRLVQAWIDRGDPQAGPGQAEAPFTVVPPVLRIEGGKSTALRIAWVPQEQALPVHQESVFWVNVLSVGPQAQHAQAGSVSFAFRTRIKLFVRPPGLPGKVEEAPAALQWRLPDPGRAELEVYNPTAYHVTLSRLSLMTDSAYTAADPPMVGPGQVLRIPLSGAALKAKGTARLSFSSIDDHGATQHHRLDL